MCVVFYYILYCIVILYYSTYFIYICVIDIYICICYRYIYICYRYIYMCVCVLSPPTLDIPSPGFLHGGTSTTPPWAEASA